MNIKEVKTAFKIADVVLDKEHKQNHIKIEYLTSLKDEKDNLIDNNINTSRIIF